MQKKLKFDELKRAYAEALGYQTMYLYECQWKAFLDERPKERQRIKAAQTLKYEGPAWKPG